MVAFPRRAVAALTRHSRSEWPTEELRAGPRRSSWSRGQQWLVVIASFLLGLCLASAAFVLVWSREAERADSNEAALAQADADRRLAVSSATRLERALAESTAALSAARADVRRARVLAKGIAGSGGALAADAADADEAARRLAADAGALAAGARRVTNAVSALEAYVSKTPASEIDPAYLSTQLSYLDAATEKLQAQAGGLGSAAESLRAARAALTARVERLQTLTARIAAKREGRSD